VTAAAHTRRVANQCPEAQHPAWRSRAAFASFKGERPDALFVASDAYFYSRRVQLHPPSDAPRDRCDLCSDATCRSRWLDELRKQHNGCLSTVRRICRPHTQRREASGVASRAIEQFELVINVPIARMLGLAVPPDAHRHRDEGDRGSNRREFITAGRRRGRRLAAQCTRPTAGSAGDRVSPPGGF